MSWMVFQTSPPNFSVLLPKCNMFENLKVMHVPDTALLSIIYIYDYNYMCVCILFWISSLPVVCFCRGIDLSQLTVAHSRSQISQLWLKSRYEEDSITSGCLIQSTKTLQSAKLSNIAKLFKSIDINRPKLCARCPIGIKAVVVIKSKENATHLFLLVFTQKMDLFQTPSESFNHQCPSSNFSPRRVAASFQQREARGNGSTTWRR